MHPNRRFAVAPLALALAAWPGVALAHHGMDGRTPDTLAQGLLSGLAHPVIGPDHVAMLLLVGAYCAAMNLGLLPIASFVGAGLLGCAAHLARLDLPQAETTLAVSLVLVGLAVSLALRAPRGLTTLVLAATGLLHGYAYGESMVGAEPTPLVAYLAGLLLVQFALTALVGRLVRAAVEQGRAPASLAFVRALGAASVVVGAIGLS